MRPVQSATSVIRISPNPRQWVSSASEQQSVILQNALTNSANQPPQDTETSHMQTGSESDTFIQKFILNREYFRYFVLRVASSP